jgi:hypothetical protein
MLLLSASFLLLYHLESVINQLKSRPGGWRQSEELLTQTNSHFVQLFALWTIEVSKVDWRESEFLFIYISALLNDQSKGFRQASELPDLFFNFFFLTVGSIFFFFSRLRAGSSAKGLELFEHSRAIHDQKRAR